MTTPNGINAGLSILGQRCGTRRLEEIQRVVAAAWAKNQLDKTAAQSVTYVY
jgi:hypothetical protein